MIRSPYNNDLSIIWDDALLVTSTKFIHNHFTVFAQMEAKIQAIKSGTFNDGRQGTIVTLVKRSVWDNENDKSSMLMGLMLAAGINYRVRVLVMNEDMTEIVQEVVPDMPE